MSDKPKQHGINDQRMLGPGLNGMRIGPPKLLGLIDPYGDVPDLCEGCGAPLHGCALDSPNGWRCSMDCPADSGGDRIVPEIAQTGMVPFSATGLNRPSSVRADPAA